MKTIIQRFRFVVLILFFCLIEQLTASSLNTYFFASGQDEEINIFWDYCGEENLLGCNMLRSETFGGEYLQVNDNLITSPDTDFSFQDTSNIIDTLDYFYKISYICPDSTFTELFPIFSLKQIIFEVINTNQVEVYLEMRKNKSYGYDILVSWDNSSWDIISQSGIVVCVSFLINPYNFSGNYLQMEFYDFELADPYLGHFKLSMDYLISIIIGSDINNEIIPGSSNILYQNYPNPFNPETTIKFSTTESTENTEITIYNLKGQKVKTLLNEKLTAGKHSIVWKGKNDNSRKVASGIYLYKLKTKNYSAFKKMMLLK